MAYLLSVLFLVLFFLSTFRNRFTKDKQKLVLILLCSFAVFSFLAQIYVTWSHKQTEASLIASRDYADVAKLDMMGKSFETSGSSRLEITTPISKLLEGTIHNENKAFFLYNCGSQSKEQYKEIIRIYPKYPFSYLALTTCLYHEGDITWKEYAQKAQEILDKTTTIEGHHPRG